MKSAEFCVNRSPGTGAAAIKAFALLATLTSTGCGLYANLSASAIGCPAEEIAIYDKRRIQGDAFWKADCRGRTFYCSYDSGNVKCTESLATPIAAEASKR
jgi:hypothetical protein